MTMDWSDDDYSDDSDICNSDIEFELYSQLHYKDGNKKPTCSGISSAISKHKGISSSGTNTKNQFQFFSEGGSSPSSLSTLSSDIKDWEYIVSSSDENEDSCSRNGSKKKDEPDKLWKISDLDSERVNQRIVRYYSKTRVRCAKCRKVGHDTSDCNQPKKVRRCCLCGNRSHVMRFCKISKSLGHCYNEKEKCTRCNQRGHGFDQCPDKWRQFHLTVKPGLIIEAKDFEGEADRQECYHCCKTGHLPYICEHRWDQKNCVFLSPTVFSYDCCNDEVKSAQCNEWGPKNRGFAKTISEGKATKEIKVSWLSFKEIQKNLSNNTHKKTDFFKSTKPKKRKLEDHDANVEKNVKESKKKCLKNLAGKSKIESEMKRKMKNKKKSKKVSNDGNSSNSQIKKASKKKSEKTEINPKKSKKNKLKNVADAKNGESEISPNTNTEADKITMSYDHELKKPFSSKSSKHSESCLHGQTINNSKLSKTKKKISKLIKKKKESKKVKSASNGSPILNSALQSVNTQSHRNGEVKHYASSELAATTQNISGGKIGSCANQLIDVPFPCA